jgi:hypothetical protein
MKKPTRHIAGLLALGCLLLSPGLAAAGAGDLKPVACDPAEVLPYPAAYVGVTLAQKATDADAPLSARAQIGTGTVGNLDVRAAADYSNASAEKADLLWVDLTGKGKFGAKGRLAMTKMPNASSTTYCATCGPASLPASHDGRDFLVGVRGYYYGYGERHRASLAMVVVVQGKCRFGSKLLPIRFVDSGGNFRFDDRSKIEPKSPRPPAIDLVLVDTGDGTFGGSVVRACYGQPVLVNGAWYDVRISADGTKATAQPTKVTAGLLAVPSKQWEISLVSDGRPTMVSGGAEPVPVPAGSYQLVHYREWSAPDANGRRACALAGLGDFREGKAKTVTITAGRTAKLTAGSPFSVELSAKPSGQGSIRLGMSAPTMNGGMELMLITPRGGWVFGRPARPRIRIRDESGKLVDTVSLEYG